MGDGLTVTEYSMLRSMERVNSLSQNIANGNTPAYKAERSYSEVLASLASPESVSLPQPLHDFSVGTVKQTGRSSDLALYSEGFFVVDAAGELLLTRNGQFSTNARGELVTAEGYVVMGHQGSIRVDDDFSVHADGGIWQDEQLLDSLRVVSVETEYLQVAGGGRFRVDDAQSLEPVDSPVVLQGALESSNVDARHELTELIKVMRQYEMQQRVIKAYDQITDSGISTLGDF